MAAGIVQKFRGIIHTERLERTTAAQLAEDTRRLLDKGLMTDRRGPPKSLQVCVEARAIVLQPVGSIP